AVDMIVRPDESCPAAQGGGAFLGRRSADASASPRTNIREKSRQPRSKLSLFAREGLNRAARYTGSADDPPQPTPANCSRSEVLRRSTRYSRHTGHAARHSREP